MDVFAVAEGQEQSIRGSGRPRHGEIIVFDRAPRRSSVVVGEVYRCEKHRGKPFLFVQVDKVASGYPRYSTATTFDVDKSSWRPATVEERERVVQ